MNTALRHRAPCRLKRLPIGRDRSRRATGDVEPPDIASAIEPFERIHQVCTVWRPAETADAAPMIGEQQHPRIVENLTIIEHDRKRALTHIRRRAGRLAHHGKTPSIRRHMQAIDPHCGRSGGSRRAVERPDRVPKPHRRDCCAVTTDRSHRTIPARFD